MSSEGYLEDCYIHCECCERCSQRPCEACEGGGWCQESTCICDQIFKDNQDDQ